MTDLKHQVTTFSVSAENVRNHWGPLIPDLIKQQPDYAGFWQTSLLPLIHRVSNELLGTVELREYPAHPKGDFVGWSLHNRESLRGCVVRTFSPGRGVMSFHFPSTSSLEGLLHALRSDRLDEIRYDRMSSDTINPRHMAAHVTANIFVVPAVIEAIKDTAGNRVAQAFRAESHAERRKFLPTGVEFETNRLLMEPIISACSNADNAFLREAGYALIYQGADPRVVAHLQATPEQERLAYLDVFAVTLGKFSDRARASKLMIDYPGAGPLLARLRQDFESSPASSDDLPAFVAKGLDIPRRWALALLSSPDLSARRIGMIADWRPALVNYKPQYISAPIGGSLSSGVAAFLDLVKSLEEATELDMIDGITHRGKEVRRYIDTGRMIRGSGVRKSTLASIIWDANDGNPVAADLAEQGLPPSVIAELISYTACLKFLECRAKKVFSNPPAGLSEMRFARDLVRTMSNSVFVPLARHMGFRDHEGVNAAARIMLADAIERVTLDEFIGAVSRYHHSATIDSLLATNEIMHQSWPAISAPRRVALGGQSYDVEVVSTAAGLIALGLSEQHCVGTYGEACAYEGTHIAVIRNSAGRVEATVELVSWPDGELTLGQVLAACNQVPHAEITEVARIWTDLIADDPATDLMGLEAARRQRCVERDNEIAMAELHDGIIPAKLSTAYTILRKAAPTFFPERSAEDYLKRVQQNPILGVIRPACPSHGPQPA